MKNKKKTAKSVLTYIFIVLNNIVFGGTAWLLVAYDEIELDQILFQLKAPAVGTSKNVVSFAVILIIIGGLLLCFLEIFLYRLLSGKCERLKRNIKYYNYSVSERAKMFENNLIIVPVALFVIASTFCFTTLNVKTYIQKQLHPSLFIEENYVTPTSENIIFPEKKRNLIYIFLESMENTYLSESDGGYGDTDYIPELTSLAKENVSFSNTPNLGGALSYKGTTWTAAAMFSQTAGLTIKVPLNAPNYGGENTFLPGVVSLGNILEKNGYVQEIMMGSDAAFAGRDSYFSEHGNYKIVDLYEIRNEERLPQNYYQWWGYEDEKLFEFAKEDIYKLYESGKPFNFTMLTADSHFPNGYLCHLCEDEYESQYGNVLACSSRQVTAFVEWIKEQPFYENTAVIIVGDHTTMDPDFLADIDESYTRTTYNCFLNSAVSPLREKSRLFGSFDMFPTTLAAMGVKIEGERLGLGTNLFSGEETLTEIYGYDFLNEELQKNSKYYNEKFLWQKADSVIYE